jgi:hypothetical protein
MYRYYNKEDYIVMEYNFDSIAEFINYLDSTQTTRVFESRGNLASDDGDVGFTQTRSLAEAEELCKYGYHRDFEKLVELKYSLEKYIKMKGTRGQQYNYYVGYAPDVKAYLEGNPLSMFDRQNPKRKHIDIYYNSAILGDVSTEEIFNRGAVTLCLVEILENMGFSVGLNVFTMSGCDGQIHYAKFNLKKNEEKLNIQKLYFPLCHPSFLRRLVFRLREETPDIRSGWTQGYGRTCDDYTIRQIINLQDNDIVICQPDEMGVKGRNIVDDANAMFDYINKFNKSDIELKHIEREEGRKLALTRN